MPRLKNSALNRLASIKSRVASAVESDSRSLKDAHLKKCVRDNEKLRSESNQMIVEKEALKHENETLHKNIVESKSENEQLKVNFAQLEEKHRSLTLDLKEAERRIGAFEERVENLHRHCRKYEEKIKEKENELEQKMEEAETWRIQCLNLEKAADQISAKLQELEDVQQKEIVAQSEEMKTMENNLEVLKLKTPTRGAKLKSFDKIKSKWTVNDRCRRSIELIAELVGSDNLDSFITHFVAYVARDSRFSFRLEMTPTDGLLASVKWNLSDSFLTGFRNFSQKILGFSVIPSVHVIRSLKRLQKPEDEYDVEVETIARTTRTGKIVNLSSPIVRIRNLEASLIRRIETLSQSNRLIFDDFTSEEIVIAYGGDKGGSQTKLCAIIGNVRSPNNPRGILVLGFFDGNDDHKTLKDKFGPVFQQINQLKSLKYNENGKPVERKIRTILVSDWKFVSSVLNHPGQSSRQPCPWCHSEWSTHGSQKATLATFQFEKVGALRTLSEYRADGDPLIHVDPADIPPPPLHTCSGINQHYIVDWTIAAVNKMDYGHDELPDNLRAQIKFLKSKKQEEELYSGRVSDLQDAIHDLGIAEDILTNIKITLGKRSKTGESCSASFCLVGNAKRDSFKQSDSFICINCNREYHEICSMNFTSDERIRLRGSICYECEMDLKLTPPVLLEIVQEKSEYLHRELDNDLDVLVDVRDERIELENLIKKSAGPKKKELEKLYSDVGANSRVHFQEMNGNMCRNFLRSANVDHVFSLFEDSMETRLMAAVAKDLGEIMSHANNAVKSDEDIDEIRAVIDRFTENLKEAQPNASVAPKLHGFSHLIPYLEKHRTWGRVSEQAIESLHCIFNMLNQRYSPVRNTHRHTYILLQMIMNYNRLFDIGESWEDRV